MFVHVGSRMQPWDVATNATLHSYIIGPHIKEHTLLNDVMHDGSPRFNSPNRRFCVTTKNTLAIKVGLGFVKYMLKSSILDEKDIVKTDPM